MNERGNLYGNIQKVAIQQKKKLHIFNESRRDSFLSENKKYFNVVRMSAYRVPTINDPGLYMLLLGALHDASAWQS